MRRKRFSVILLICFLAVLVVPVGSVAAAPRAQGGNLLNSPGFETGFNAQGVDPAWARWHEERACKEDPNFNYACKPEWYSETNPALVHSGWQAQGMGVRYTPWHGGVMQTVNAPAGSAVRFTVWGRAHASNDNFPAPSDGNANARIQVGIDPNGGGLWYQNVIWSGQINPLDTWQSVSVEATVGASGKVTVFTSANFAGISLSHLDVKFDDATLEVVTPPTATPRPQPTSPPRPLVTNTPLPTPTPEPTATPVNTPTPTATPEPTATATPANGEICVGAFDDGNRNGVQDGIEGLISGVTITLFNGQEIIATQTTNAMEGQICFKDVEPGPYQVFQTVPPSRQMTTVDSVPFELQAGQTVVVLFGSAANLQPAPTTVAQEPDPSDTATDQPTPVEPSDSGLGDALYAVSGIVVLLVAAVLIGLFFIFRNR